MDALKLTELDKIKHPIAALFSDFPIWGACARERKRINRVLLLRKASEFDRRWGGYPLEIITARNFLIDLVKKDSHWACYHFFPEDEFRVLLFDNTTSLKMVDWIFAISRWARREISDDEYKWLMGGVSLVESIKFLAEPEVNPTSQP